VLWLFLILAFVLIAGFYSGTEMGAYCLNRIRLRERLGRKHTGARMLSAMLAEPETFVCTTLLGTNLGVYGATAVCTALWMRVTDSYAEFLSTITLAPVVLVLTDVVPKSIFQAHCNSLMYYVVGLVRGTMWALWPVVWLLRGITRALTLLFPRSAPQALPALSIGRLRDFIDEGAQDGVLSPEQQEMAANIMGLEQIPLRRAMVPLGEATMVSADSTREEVRRMALYRGHSRVPVYEGRRDHVTGLLVVLDVLCETAEANEAAERAGIRPLVRPATRLHADMPVDDALFALQRRRQAMGIVVAGDETRAIGIVTVTDLLGEIVGRLEL